MILTNVFSSGVLTSLMFQEEKHFDSLDELFSTNITLLNYNNSWIWYQFDNNLKYGSPLDDNLDQLKKKLNFLPREMIDSEVIQINRLSFFQLDHSGEGKTSNEKSGQKRGCFHNREDDWVLEKTCKP